MPWANLMVIGAAHNEDPDNAMKVNIPTKRIPIFVMNFPFGIFTSSFSMTDIYSSPNNSIIVYYVLFFLSIFLIFGLMGGKSLEIFLFSV